eukprot:m.397329 g.397329  ORF g.397329 m.397329 type:complete len:625 (+) comp28368_c2_seq13:6710-8584(+)
MSGDTHAMEIEAGAAATPIPTATTTPDVARRGSVESGEGEGDGEGRGTDSTGSTTGAPDASSPRPPKISYDIATLQWNNDHTQNVEEKYGYSGKAWPQSERMMHCDGCRQWFCESELEIDMPTLADFPRGCINYEFHCCDCGKRGNEEFKRIDLGYKAVLIAALSELHDRRQAAATATGAPGTSADAISFFDLRDEIVPYIEANWTTLFSGGDTRKNWRPGDMKASLNRYTGIFSKDTASRVAHRYGLTNRDPTLYSPLLHLPWDHKRKRKSDGRPGSDRVKSKRKQSGSAPTTSTGEEKQSYPFNTEGYRYTVAEVDEYGVRTTPNDPVFRPVRADKVTLSMMDRAPQLKMGEDWMSVTGEKGYCMSRATHGVERGSWYYEVTILQPESNDDLPEPHCRIGWAQRYANLQGPVGLCRFSYSWRDLKGTKFHQAKGSAFGEGYKPGDTIGFYIDLPSDEPPELPAPAAREYLVVYKGRNYYEQQGADKVDESKVRPLIGSRMRCYKNGVAVDDMFSNITAGKYFPAISMYMGAKVRMNFGPTFKYPPSDVGECSPMSDAVHHENATLTLLDCVTTVDRRLSEAKLESDAAAAVVVAAAAAAEAESAEGRSSEGASGIASSAADS